VVARLVFRPRAGFAGAVTLAGAAPVSAGLATVAPVAAGVRERRPRATLRDGVNEHCIVEPDAGISVRRSRDFRARNETIVGGAGAAAPAIAGAVGTSPVCNATAV
jgi:hypothetical protein